MPACIYKFGDFELDPSLFELRRNDRVQKLERIPMELLILLAEKQGDVATRQEIMERLWGKIAPVPQAKVKSSTPRSKVTLRSRDGAKTCVKVTLVPLT